MPCHWQSESYDQLVDDTRYTEFEFGRGGTVMLGGA